MLKLRRGAVAGLTGALYWSPPAIRVEPTPPDVVRRDPNTQREALAAAADPYSRVFVVLLDTLHTTSPGSHVVQRPLIDVLHRLVTPDDLIGVLTQSERPADLVLGRRLDSIEDLLRQYWAKGEGHTLTDIGGSLAGIDDSDRMERALESCFGAKLVRTGDALTWEPWYIDDGPARRLFSELPSGASWPSASHAEGHPPATSPSFSDSPPGPDSLSVQDV